jgi:hypothetical protein
MKKTTDAKLVLLGEENSGRDEMNLAGNPFALLQAASKNGQSFIRNEWERTLPNGRIVTAKWEVNGHAELGLPGPNEELLYLVLLQITREAADKMGVWPQKVTFSRYDLIERLNWPVKGSSYQLLQDGFVRLQSVSIHAVNSFWDARAKVPFRSVGFGLINEFALASEPTGRKLKNQTRMPLSWFEWNKTVYESFLAGNVRSLALEFTLSLDLPTSRRLFRFLDMMRGATSPPRREFAIGLFKLCERLGMTSYKYASKIKEKLQPAIEELKERHYLEDVRFEKSKDGTELAFFAFASVGRSQAEVVLAQNAEPAKPNNLGLFEANEYASGSQPTMSLMPEGPKKGAKSVKSTKPEPPPLDNEPDIRLDAMRCHAVFVTLPEEERNELMELAKEEVSPIWHDRIGLPESPMSLGLWQLVAERYADRLK